MPSLSDYLTPAAPAEIITLQLNMMTLASLPVTSWQPGSVPISLVQADAQTLSDMEIVIAAMAQGGFVSTAKGPWLALHAQSQFQVTPKPAVFTQGWLTLTDVGGGGPYAISIGQLYAAPTTTSTQRFQNITGGTLARNGTLVLLFQAESPGAVYNLANSAIATLLTTLPGVTVTNVDPGSSFSGGGLGTWISQLGTDAESDVSIANRCVQKWSTLGTGATVATYQYWAVTSTPTVTRVNVLENTPTGGQVTIYCAGSSGPSSGADVASVQAYIGAVGSNTGTRPLCVTVNVLAASSNTINISGTVSVARAFATQAQSLFAAALATYAASLPVGGTVYFSKIVDLIQSLPGVIEVVLTSPTVDVAQTAQQVAIFNSAGLTWNAV